MLLGERGPHEKEAKEGHP